MPRTVAQKMGVKPGSRTFFMNAPESVHETIDLPDLVVGEGLDGEFDYMHLFVITQAEMNDQFPRLKAHLRAGGMLWLSWPKGRKLGSDLTLPKVIEIGYNHGLVESTCLSVDPTWSGLKFTHPKRGKTYHNSYGTLPGQ
ncbi:hypothetical protein ACGFIK_21135 [Micromonospora sp. NPDC048871]|uniref:hypothetical protein n=1 Tax=Micromonospora sp. NPDC048871 TaxID=3364259 RepID=UPI0037222A5C